MNRWVSNLVLGIFVLVLVAAYGVAKQPSAYSLADLSRSSVSNMEVASEPVLADDLLARSEESATVGLPNGAEIDVVVVTTAAQQTRGLSGLTELAEDEGMLFAYEAEGSHSIWMKEMVFPIDIVWIDSEGKIVHLEEQVPTPEDGQVELPIYSSEDPARYVLELAAGVVAEQGLEVGQKVEIKG